MDNLHNWRALSGKPLTESLISLTITPNIALVRELSVVNTLQRHPLDEHLHVNGHTDGYSVVLIHTVLYCTIGLIVFVSNFKDSHRELM